MLVAALGLLVGVEAVRNHQVQLILGARHGDMQQPPLFLDFFHRAGAQVRWNTAVDHIENVDRVPLLTLGAVDVRQDQVVVIEQGRTGMIARRFRWIEGQVGEKVGSGRAASAIDRFTAVIAIQQLDIVGTEQGAPALTPSTFATTSKLSPAASPLVCRASDAGRAAAA
jgi:hypothetical protein